MTRLLNGSAAWRIGVVLFFAAVAVVYLRPMLFQAADRLVFKPEDDHAWGAAVLEGHLQSLLSNPRSFFQGNFFYGVGNALFGNDLWLGMQVSFAPTWLITRNTALAYNITWHVSLVLAASAMYLAAQELTRNRWAALLAGVVFAFGPISTNFGGTHHSSYAAMWGMPLVLYFGLRFSRTCGIGYFAAAVFCVGLQFITVIPLAVMAALSLLAFAVVPGLWHSAIRRDWKLPLRMLVTGLVVGALFLPLLFGYLGYSRDWDASRDTTEVHTGSVELRDYLSPTDRLHWYGTLRERFPVAAFERSVFPGFVPVVAASLGLATGVASFRRNRRLAWVVLGTVVLGALAVLLSLGTHWKWHENVTDIELPYLFFFEEIPALRAIRSVARFSLMGNFALAILAAVGVVWVAERASSRSLGAPLVGAVLVGAVLLEGFPDPIYMIPVPEDRPLQTVLSTAPGNPLLLLPVSREDEAERHWLSTRVGAGPLVNGYAGFIWPQYWYFRDVTTNIPRSNVPELVAALRAYGVRSIVIDTSRLEDTGDPVWTDMESGPLVESVLSSGNWRIIVLQKDPADAARSWTDVDVDVLLDSAPAKAGVITAFSISNLAGRPWLPPLSSKVRRAELSWIDSVGRTEMVSQSVLLPPPFLLARGTHSTVLHVFTPGREGEYTLRLEVDGQTIVEREVQIGPVRPQPFTGTGAGLRAELRLLSPRVMNAHPGDRLQLHVDAVNSGTTVWDGEGNLRLGYRWFRKLADGTEEELPQFEGRILWFGHLHGGSILPGNGYSFTGTMTAPDEPGEYVVRVSMLAELVAWFENEPLKLYVKIGPGT